MMDLSICIPTYNRARLLSSCLACLSEFSDKSFELIIGNNASSDGTDEVVTTLSKNFPHFYYLRHSENIGFARNMDSLVRRATRKYVYILSDDDIVFEEALKLSISMMDANQEIIAVVGQYLSRRSLDSSIRIDYAHAVATIFKRGSHAQLIENLSVCDGHPVLRREVFERHGAYLDRTFGLSPLYFSLLHHGDIVAVDKPFFQHLTNEESLTGSMVEAWFVDTVNADLELSIAACLGAISPDQIFAVRQRFLQLIYFQAGRMAINRKSYYLLWLFLRRLTAINGVTDELLIKCEYHFMHDFLVSRIASILKDAEFKIVYFNDSEFCKVIVAELKQLLPDIEFHKRSSDSLSTDIEILICQNRDNHELPSDKVPRVAAISDLASQVRLTMIPAELGVLDGRITLKYMQSETLIKLAEPSHAFQTICTPYSQLV
jgi:glycosyltransferase involved in cell wall biosynthesis